MSNEQAASNGMLIVVSGASGTGKTSICNGILQRDPLAVWSVSATTRSPRAGEVDGSDYKFLSHDEFQAKREAGEFLESAQYLNHWYGTLRRSVMDHVEKGRHVVMEIEVQGGVQVAEKVPGSLRIFVLPPSRESLQDRLAGRGTETEEQREKRFAESEREIRFAKESGVYNHFVVNRDLEAAIVEVLALIEKHDTART
jgi:guanylate kinase